MKATATFEKKSNDPKKDKKQSDNKFPFFGKKKDKKKEEDCDDCKKKKDAKKKDEKKKKKSKKVNETTGIMSFKQFLNESHDFQDQYAPENFDTEDDEDDSIIPLEGSDTESEEDETLHSDEDTQMAHDGHGHHAGIEDEGQEDDFGGEDDVEDTWNSGDDFGDEDIDDEPVIPKRGASKIEKINNELMSVNSEIGRLLDQYKSDNDIQTYKKQASPLLAKRKELQAQLDAQFNIGGESEDDFADLEMSEDDFTA